MLSFVHGRLGGVFGKLWYVIMTAYTVQMRGACGWWVWRWVPTWQSFQLMVYWYTMRYISRIKRLFKHKSLTILN